MGSNEKVFQNKIRKPSFIYLFGKQQFAEKAQQTNDEEYGHPTHTNKTSASASTGQNGCCASTSSAAFTSTSCNAGTSQGAGTSCGGGGGGMGTAGAGTSSQAKQRYFCLLIYT